MGSELLAARFVPLASGPGPSPRQLQGGTVGAVLPPRGSADEKALALCRSCPELEPCKTYALSCSPDTFRGIWGGLSERDRRSLRRGAAMSAALDDVDEPTDADLVAIEAAGPADPAATNGHGGRRCSECAGPIGPDRSDAAVTCSRACADARGGRKRAGPSPEGRPSGATGGSAAAGQCRGLARPTRGGALVVRRPARGGDEPGAGRRVAPGKTSRLGEADAVGPGQGVP